MKFFTPRRVLLSLGALALAANAATAADAKPKDITIGTGIPGSLNDTLAANNITIPARKKGYIVIDLTLGGTTKEQQSAVNSIVSKVNSLPLGFNATVYWGEVAATAKRIRRRLMGALVGASGSQPLTPLPGYQLRRRLQTADGPVEEHNGSHCSTDPNAKKNSTSIIIEGDELILNYMKDFVHAFLNGTTQITVSGQPTREYVCSSQVTMRSTLEPQAEPKKDNNVAKIVAPIVVVGTVALVGAGVAVHLAAKKAAAAAAVSA